MNVVVFGATSMVGIEVLHRCLDGSRVHAVVTIGRRSSGMSDPKLREVRHLDFDNRDPLHPHPLSIDAIFSCLGICQGRVPDTAFREVACDYLQRLLRVA